MSRLREERHKVLVEKLIQASLDLAKKQGWSSVDVRTLSKKLKFSTIVIYRHFGNKQGLMTSIQGHGFEALRGLFLAELQSKAGPKQQLINISRTFLEFAKSEPFLYKLMFGLAGVESAQPPFETVMAAGGVVQEVLCKLTSGSRVEIEFLKWWALCQGFISIQLNPEMAPGEKLLAGAFAQSLEAYINQL